MSKVFFPVVIAMITPHVYGAAWTTSGAGTLGAARIEHTATQLPDGRLLVAGGRNGSTRLASAEIYDPRSGTWSPTGSMSRPRYGHTATLLKNGRVLVAGGYDGVYLATAEIYDPATGAWTPTGSMAQSRYHFAAVLLNNGEVLISGGFNGSTLNTAQRYNPATGLWQNAASMAQGRSGHTLNLLLDGRVLVAGGSVAGTRLATAQVYNPATNAWSNTGSMAGARYRHAATLLRDGTVLVTGGYNNGSLTSVQRWNPATNAWTAAAPLATARQLHTASLLPDGTVLIVGGYNAAVGRLITTERFDPAANAWSQAGSLTQRRAEHTATLLADGRVLIAGGSIATNSGTTSAEAFKPSIGPWTRVSSMMFSRTGHTATLLNNGRTLVAGGQRVDHGIQREAELFDPGTNTWSPTGSMLNPRIGHSATLLSDGKVLVSGGWDNESGVSSSAEIYDTVTQVWSPTASMLMVRRWHTATLLRDGRVLVTGGGQSTDTTKTAELFDPAAGRWSAVADMTAPREGHSATLLPDGRVLIVGGYSWTDSGRIMQEAAEIWDPATGSWSPAGTLNEPRYAHAATLLPSGRVLVAGGLGHGTPGSPMNAEIWSPATNAWSLAGRLNHERGSAKSVLLPSGGVLLFGGDAEMGPAVFYAELFHEAGSSWTLTGQSDIALQGHTATLLPDSRVLIAGGSVEDGTFNFATTASFTEYDHRRSPAAPAQPSISAVGGSSSFPAPINRGAEVTITGNDFLGIPNGAQDNMPRVYLRAADSAGASDPGRLIDVTESIYSRTFSDGQLTFRVPSDLRSGSYLLWVQAAGVPSDARIVRIPGPDTHMPGPLSAPILASMSPSSATAGGPGFTLSVFGQHFTTSSVVQWNGSNRATTFVSVSTLTASIPTGDTTSQGTATVRVFDPGAGASNALTFTINAAPPSSCIVSQGNWANQSFPAQAGTFEARFEATPETANMDGVAGLSSGPASAYANLASIVRFNTDGFIDARNGGAYTAVSSIPYTAGTVYHFRLTVNVPARTYSAHVRSGSSPEQTVADNYAFRTEQGDASALNNLGVFASIGSERVCNLSVTPAAPNPAPSIASINPASRTAGGPGFVLQARGSGFISGSRLRWNGSDRPTRVLNADTLEADIAAGDISAPGTASVTVFNPGPGGGTSNAMTFVILGPQSANWTVTGSMTSGRSDTATLLADGRVLATTGDAENRNPAEIYERSTGRWTQTATTGEPDGREAVRLQDGRVLITGGNLQECCVPDAELFDPAIGVSSPTGSMNSPRQEHTLSLLANGRVLAAAGRDASQEGNSQNSAELYDPATGVWSNTGSLAVARQGHTATVLGNGRVLVTGGLVIDMTANPAISEATRTAELYDPASGTWGPTGSMSTARTGHEAALLADGRVLVVGGSAECNEEAFASAEIYDPATGTWSPAPSMSVPRLLHTATRLSDGRVLVAGGRPEHGGGVHNSAELYEPAANRWVSAGYMSEPRSGHTATLLATGEVLVVSGGTAELFNPGSSPPQAAFFDGFNYPDGLITNENPTSPRSEKWVVTQGSLFASNGEGWTGVPDNANPNATSSNGTGSALFRALTVPSNFATELTFRLTILGYVSVLPANPWDGVHVYLRYTDSNNYYQVSVNRRDGRAAIKKRRAGSISTFNTPLFPIPLNSPRDVRVTAVNNPNGSVTLQLFIGGQLAAQATDTNLPLTAPGKVGMASENTNFRFDDFTVDPPLSSPPPPPSPPALAGMSPSSAAAGGPGFTLSVFGQRFSSSSVVEWNGSARTTTFVSPSTVTASILASDIASSGTAQVTVLDPAGRSNALAFAVEASSRPTTVVSLTFDDGSADQMIARQLLNERGLKGTFYVNSGQIGTSGFYLTLDQLRAIAASGHEIGGHTLNHVDLTTVSAAEARRQVCDDRAQLVEWGFGPTSFAYPYGRFNGSLKDIAQDCGYASARAATGLAGTSQPRAETIPPADLYAIRTPEAIHSHTTLSELQQLVTGAEQAGGGWVPLLFHRVCDGCSEFGVSSATLRAFLDWLAARGPATVVRTVGDVIGAPPPPAAAFFDGFSYPDGLITNENSGSPRSEKWIVTQGSLFASGGQGWTGVPDNVTPNAASSNGTGSAMFRALTVPSNFGTEVTVQVTIHEFVSALPANPWDGVHVFLRYLDASNYYWVSINRRDGRAAIKKRRNGAVSTFTTPVFPLALNTPHQVRVLAVNDPDGSVTIQLFIGGQLIAQAVDNNQPLTAPGKVGMAGENTNFRFDDFTVPAPSGGGTSMAALASPMTLAAEHSLTTYD